MEKTFISWLSSTNTKYTCPITLPVHWNPQHNSFDCCLSHLPINSKTFATFLDPAVNHFMRQTLPTVSRKNFFMNILCIDSFCPQNPHNRRLLFGSTLLKHGRHFGYWNQPLNMRISYLGLSWSWAVMPTSDIYRKPITSNTVVLLNLWPIYWLSLVLT
jgi:hypothetical protein